MNKKKKKILGINTPHVNKWAKFSQAEKAAAELNRQDKKTEQPTTPSWQTNSSRSVTFNQSREQTYRCPPDLDYKTYQQAIKCQSYVPPRNCSSMWSNTKICSVIERAIDDF